MKTHSPQSHRFHHSGEGNRLLGKHSKLIEETVPGYEEEQLTSIGSEV
ncbi:hypothetical protein ACFLYI_00180 [Chloroflexota bacterium]